MQGTLVCAMTDEEDRTAIQTAVELSERLGLRLVPAGSRLRENGHLRRARR